MALPSTRRKENLFIGHPTIHLTAEEYRDEMAFTRKAAFKRGLMAGFVLFSIAITTAMIILILIK